MATQRRSWTTVFLLVLFLAAFIPRAVYPVSRPLQWYERSFRFIDAVFHGQWADTVVSEHPGVTPMVLIGSAQHAYHALLRVLGTSPQHPLDIAGRAFRAEVAVSILPLALAIALGVLVIWWLLRELFGEAVAWAGAGLLALDPFHIAISKVVHVDALLSVLMILSALTLLLHLRREISWMQGMYPSPTSMLVRNDNGQGGYRWLLASGVLAGLAFLTKSPAYFLVPFLGLSLLVMRGRARLVQGYLVPALLWMGAAAVTYVVLWPAMWVQPGQTLSTVFAGVLKHFGRAHPQPLYYLGELTTVDPGPGFYALTLLVKTTVLSLPLFVAGLAAPLSARWRCKRRLLGLVIAYFVFFFVQMSLGAKKDPRYLLPAFPALDIVAGVGLVMLAKHLTGLTTCVRRWVPTSNLQLPTSNLQLVAAVLAVQAALVWPYHPYYITYASPLVGGPAGAQRLLVATPESEGLDLVAGYLNRLPQADRLRVGVQMPAREAFRQYFVGEITDTREAGLDYLVFAEVYVRRHVAEDQWGEQWDTFKYRRPAYTAYLHGLPYAWVYRVDAEPQEPAVSKQVCLGEQIHLLGYTLVIDGEPLDRQVIHPGEVLWLTLHWAASGTPAGDYNVFVHLLGPDGTLVTQQDNSPVRGTQPTWAWEAGLRLDDPYELVVPPDATAGPYTLVAGMYDWRTGERLAARMYSSALSDCTVPLPENRVPLATFEVRPERVPWWEVAAWILAGALAIAGLIAARPTFPKVGPNVMNWVHNNFREGAGGWWGRWGMVLAYVLLTLGMTYPLLFRLGSHYVGTGGDLLIFPWNDWWSRKCLLEGRNLFFTTWLFYPRGVSLVYHNFAWLNTALWLPLSPLVGSIAAYNLIFLFNLALGGIGMYLLVHYMTGEPRAAFVAGLIFAFWPCRMSHYNHPNMISIGWIPLFLLFLMRTIREKPKRMYSRMYSSASSASSALLGGLFLALTGLARWLHLLFTGGLALLYLGYSVLRERQYWNRRTVAALALMFGLAALVMLPLLSPLVLAQIKGGEKAEDVFSTDPEIYSTDLVSYFVPDRSHPLFQPWLADLWSRMRRGAYLGYGALVLAALGLWRGRRDRGLWLVVGVGLFVLSLGPNLQVAGRQFDVTLPYAWVQDWPVVQVLRHPNRFSVYLSLPVAVLAGYGMAWLTGPTAASRACPEADRRSHCRRARRAWLWTVCVGALVLFEYLPWPYPTVQPSVPPFYHQLAQEPGEFAILDLPMGARTVAKPYMYYATVHGKPLVEGHVSRLPVSAYDFIDSVPLLRGLHQDNEMDPALGDVSRQLSALAQANVRYVILHPDLVPPDQMARWQDWLGVAPAFADQQTVVYRTQPQYGQDFEFVGELGDGIGVVRATLSSSSLAYDGMLEARLVWGTRSAPGQDWLARLALVSPAGEEVQWVNFEPCAGCTHPRCTHPRWPTSQWGANGVARGSGVLRLNLPDEGGTYTVTVQLVDPVTSARAGQPFPMGRVEVQAAD